MPAGNKYSGIKSACRRCWSAALPAHRCQPGHLAPPHQAIAPTVEERALRHGGPDALTDGALVVRRRHECCMWCDPRWRMRPAHVVIDRMPFSMPDGPVVATRVDRIKEERYSDARR